MPLPEKRFSLRLRWTGPIPPNAPHPGEETSGRSTEFGMQLGRDVVAFGTLQPDGSVAHEAAVTAYTDSRQRLRFRGPCIQGTPEQPFVYLSFRYVGARGWIGRGKAFLLTLDRAFIDSLPDGAVLESTMSNLGHRPPHHVQEWTLVAPV